VQKKSQRPASGTVAATGKIVRPRANQCAAKPDHAPEQIAISRIRHIRPIRSVFTSNYIKLVSSSRSLRISRRRSSPSMVLGSRSTLKLRW